MIKGSIDTLTITRIASGAVSKNRFVTFANAQAGLDGVVLGVSKLDAVAGDALPLTLVGVVDMEAGGPISNGDALVSSATGLPITKGANVNVTGRALNAAAIGERVGVLLTTR